MAVLTIDTASVNCAVHLRGDDGVVLEKTDVIGRGHAEHLLPMIDEALLALALTHQSLSRIGVAIGPGSFTGIRVGISVARGFGVALNIPVVGLSVLDALSRQNTSDRPCLVALDAKRSACYCASYRASGEIMDQPILQQNCNNLPAEWQHQTAALIGSGASFFADQFEDAMIISKETTAPIATYADMTLTATPETHKPAPLYLRSADAKPQDPSKKIARTGS